MLVWLKRIIHDFLSVRGFPAEELTCEFDIDLATQELMLKSHARESGKANLPQTGAKLLDGVESKVVLKIRSHLDKITDNANNKMVGYWSSLRNADINTIFEQANNSAENVSLQITTIASQAEQELTKGKLEYARALAEYDRFRDANNLFREPDYPEAQFLNWVFVFLALFAEAALNSYFFAQGSSLGLLGGLFQSLAVAALNVLPAALLVGLLLLRAIHHVSAWMRRPAYILLLFYPVGVFVFNLAVAHYRDILSVDPEHAATMAISSLVAAPFGLADIDSWLLLGIGCLVPIFAAYEGYKSDDPYLRYGHTHRKTELAREEFEDQCKDFRDKVSDLREDFLSSLEGFRSNASIEYDVVHRLDGLRNKLMKRYKHCCETGIQACNTLLNIYRTENLKVRTEPPPNYFTKLWRPAKREYTLVQVGDYSEMLSYQEGLYRRLPSLFEGLRNDIERICREAYEKLNKLSRAVQSTSTEQI